VEYRYPDGTRCYHPVFYNIQVTMVASNARSSTENRYVMVRAVSANESMQDDLIADEVKTILAAIKRIRAVLTLDAQHAKLRTLRAFEISVIRLGKILSGRPKKAK